MIGNFVHPIIGYIADIDSASGSSVDINIINADAVFDDYTAVLKP